LKRHSIKNYIHQKRGVDLQNSQRGGQRTKM